jgi:6-phosphogluconate dehydrogenase
VGVEIGMVGLGKMGGNMTRRLLKGGHRVIAFDPRAEAVQELAGEGAGGANSLAALVEQLSPPRGVWLMVPSGPITEETVTSLIALLSPGDSLIDGGNSNYKDTQRRAAMAQAKGLHFVDVGTSGGIWGPTEGYSLMVGGDADVVERYRPIFATLAPGPDQGWGRVGPVGAGHFVKMIHNGIEYGLMQAYAEGFEIMKSKSEFHLGLRQIAEIWRYGSVVRSWLLDLAANALAEDEELAGIKPWVPDSGEGRWTVFEAIDLDVAAPVITSALQRRLLSRDNERFSDKLLASLRHQFGGHSVRRAG